MAKENDTGRDETTAQDSTSSRWYCRDSNLKVWATLFLSNTLFWGDHCTLFINNKCLLSWMDQGKGWRHFCWPETCSVQDGMSQVQQAEVWGWIRKWSERYVYLWRDVCPLKEIVSGFWRGRLGVVVEGWENIKEIENDKKIMPERGNSLANGVGEK